MGMGDGETLSAAWGLAGGGAAVHLTLPHPGSPRTRDTPARGAARRVWAALEADGVHSAVPQGPSFPRHGLCCRQGAGAALRTPPGSGAFPCSGTCVWSSDLLWAFGPFAAQSQEATEMSIPLGPFADWVPGAGAGKAASPECNPCSGP